MQNCLGIYIENDLIKYAKISKNKDSFKIESFGIEICENIAEGIKKIVEETSSYKVPICMNLQNEKYFYFDVFGLLSKNDIKKTIETEYESFCEQFNYNKKAFETKYALVQSINDENKIKVIDVLANVIDLNKQKKYLEKYLVCGIVPIGTCITNIFAINKKENVLIVNMEEKTTITTIYNGQVYSVETIENGSKEILDKINLTENSYSKAYEICKQTTLYTSESLEENSDQLYLESIIPTLYIIAQKIVAIAQNAENKISKIYLTGTLANINNIDLYFQEYFENTECKILKPDIIEEKKADINIKDYIEVNSAIALAMQGLNVGIKHLNFSPAEKTNKLKLFLSRGSNSKEKKSLNISLNSFKTALDKTEIIYLRIITYLTIFIIIFSILSKILSIQMDKKEELIDTMIATEKNQIAKINSDEATIQTKTNKYIELTSEIKSINNKISEIAEMKNSIPNLLQQIMHIMPLDAQIISIENTEEKHIKIVAQSQNYDSLGYFIARMKVDNNLTNIVTSKSKKVNKIVQITIEGDLP